jgi:glutathione S-transferase
MRVYYRPQAGRPVRVAWVLEEIEAAYEPAPISTEEAKEPAHLARHPLGRVPVLERDGDTLFESTAICLHLADEYPDAGLTGPIGSPERALVYQWAIFAMTEIEPAVVEVSRHGQSDPDRAAAGAERFQAAAAAIETALDGHDFLVGDRLTVADVVTGGVLALAQRRTSLTADYPRITAYLEHLMSRPAFERAVTATESALAR